MQVANAYWLRKKKEKMVGNAKCFDVENVIDFFIDGLFNQYAFWLLGVRVATW